MTDPRVVTFALLLAGMAGVAWVLMSFPFAAWTVVGLMGALGGVAVLFAGRSKPRVVRKVRPVVDVPSMEELPLAVFPRTREVWAPRLAWSHWLITGLSGFGKSNAINALLCHLAPMPDVQIYVSDPKRGVEFWPWRDRLAGIAKNRDETLAMLRFLNAEVEHRLDTLRERELQRKIGHGMGLPWLVLIIDEANEILHIDPNPTRKAEVVELIESMISMGRAAGLSIVLCTQRSSAQSIPTGLRDNVSGARIAFRQATNVATNMVLGDGAAQVVGDLKFLPRGVAVVWDEFTETYQRAKFQLIPDETVAYWAQATAHLAVKAVIPPARPSPSTPTQRRGRRGRVRSTR